MEQHRTEQNRIEYNSPEKSRINFNGIELGKRMREDVTNIKDWKRLKMKDNNSFHDICSANIICVVKSHSNRSTFQRLWGVLSAILFCRLNRFH